MKPEEAFKAAYANVNMAAELSQKMADVNVGNITRNQTARFVLLLNDAACAARSLDNWRKNNPIPE